MTGRSIRVGLAILAFCLATLHVASVGATEAGANTSAQADYKLGPQDKVRIKVYEWRPSRDEIYEWTAFKAEYTVNPSGYLSLPLLGDVSVKGMSTTELAHDLGERLKDRMGLLESPDATVEVVEFRPFYIVGAVEKPGEYPYRPGLTVLEAYAIGGGKPRSTLGSARLEREAITTRGDLNAYVLETQSLLARMARLQAELSDASEISWPPQFKGRMDSTGSIANAVKQEKLVFDMRRDAYKTQVSSIEQLRTFLEQEVSSLEDQLKVHSVEGDTIKTEYDMVKKLYAKGLTAAPRKLALQRNMAQVDGERLRLEASLMRARQEISKTKISIVDLQAKRSSDISTEMQKAQARLDELKGRTETSKNLLYETEILAPQSLASDENAKTMQPIFKILRRGGTLSSEQVVSQDTAVNPGDTVMVEQPSRESQLGAPAAAPLPPVASQATPTASVEISSERLR
jgi:polysaccharide export outer membrane protein/exopolysaccharide production protein ExoF